MRNFRMRALILVTGTALCLGACEEDEGEAGSPPPTGGGNLVFAPEVFSYQADPSETEFTATFSVRNDGGGPVRITGLDTNCTCLGVEADRDVVEAGEEGKITAVFDIRKLTGESEKTIIVSTDDPDMPRHRLGVEVEVPEIIEIEPSIAEWKVGENPGPKEIAVRILRDKPIRIVEARSSRRQVSLEVETVEEGREYRLVLTPEHTDDILLGFVSIRTDCELEQHRQRMAYYAIKDAHD